MPFVKRIPESIFSIAFVRTSIRYTRPSIGQVSKSDRTFPPGSKSAAVIPESVRYSAPSGPKHRSFGYKKGWPWHSVRNTSTLPSRVTRSREGTLGSATQMNPEESTASPFGSPVTATVRRVLPSALICVTQPRSPPSTTSQVPSGKATGPSGKNKPAAKTSLIVNLSYLLSVALRRQSTISRNVCFERNFAVVNGAYVPGRYRLYGI